MILVLELLIISIIGYLLGSLNTSIIVGKIYKVDITKIGSKNAGMTNTLRVLGKFVAILVIIGDVLKGVVSCYIGLYIMGDTTGLMIGGLGSVLGHNWPIYFNFKGGKGILSTFIVLLMMDYRIGLVLFGIFIIIVFITKYVSLGSTIASALFPIFAILLHKSNIFISFSIILALLAIFKHKQNIKRLLNGNENKIGKKSK